MSEPGDERVHEEPQLPGMPPDPKVLTPYERAAEGVGQALALTKERLTMLRKQRDEINDEVRDLVAEEIMLERMARLVGPKGSKGK